MAPVVRHQHRNVPLCKYSLNSMLSQSASSSPVRDCRDTHYWLSHLHLKSAAVRHAMHIITHSSSLHASPLSSTASLPLCTAASLSPLSGLSAFCLSQNLASYSFATIGKALVALHNRLDELCSWRSRLALTYLLRYGI